MKKLVFIALAALVFPSIAFGSGKLFYGSRVGMQVSVISLSGLDSAHAVIRTKHAVEDAVAFCRDYVGKVTKQCVQDELATPMNDDLRGNCPAGTFTDFFGTHYQFQGLNKASADGGPKYLLKNLDTGQVADGSSASGYPTNMAIFKALCPMTAPIDAF
jgi:hypothetical protein